MKTTIEILGIVFPAKIQPCWCCSGTGLSKTRTEDELHTCFECKGGGHLTDVDASVLTDEQLDQWVAVLNQLDDNKGN